MYRDTKTRSIRVCYFDGAEIGSTGVKVKVEFTVLTYVIRSNFLNANANRAPAMAIAA